jgi:hypothetical protein
MTDEQVTSDEKLVTILHELYNFDAVRIPACVYSSFRSFCLQYKSERAVCKNLIRVFREINTI